MIVKILLSSLFRKKTRAFLLLFSIAVCSALIFANEGFRKTCEQMVYQADTRWSGNSDLYITPKQEAGASEWIDEKEVEPFAANFQYVYQFVQSKALYIGDSDEMHYFTIIGAKPEEFLQHNPFSLKEGSLSEFTGNKLIIGECYARKMNLKVGDILSLEIADQKQDFMIAGIAEPSGLFLRDEADGGFLLAPKEVVSKLVNGNCNLMFLKLINAAELDSVMERMTAALPQYALHIGVDEAIIQAETNNYVLPFRLSVIAVIFMSIFIIYSSFHLIIAERIKIIGILRSLGCTRQKVNCILLTECMLIGLGGGLGGCVLGMGVLFFIKKVYFQGQEAVMNAPVVLDFWTFLLTVLTAVAITTLSAMLPIFKLTGKSVKEVILNDIPKQIAESTRLWPIGIILIIPVFIVPQVLVKDMKGMIIVSLCAMLALIGMNLLIPKVISECAKLISKFPVKRAIALGVRNTADFKSLVNNIRLFASTIAIMVFMMTIFGTMGTDLRNMWQRENYDISVILRNSDEASLQKLKTTKGVEAYYGVYETDAELKSHGTFLNAVIGLEDIGYFDYSPVTFLSDSQKALEKLQTGNYIVTTCIMRDQFGLQVGDTLSIAFESNTSDYIIAGFIDTSYAIGHVGYISAQNYLTDTGLTNYSKICVRTSQTPQTAKRNIMQTVSRNALSIQTKADLEAANADKVEGIFKAINTYAYFAMLIGVIGIINNIVVCFMDRKRNLALYRCIGMSKSQMGQMLTTEAISIGVISVIVGLLTGFAMVSGVPFIVGAFWGNARLVIPTKKLVLLCGAGILAMLVASAIPSTKGKKLSLMDTLRYE